MKLKIFSVRDIATDQYNNPMFLVTEGQAIRSFADEANSTSAESAIAKHPEDYELFELGEYDTDNGVFTTHPPRQVITAKAVIR